MHLAVGTVAYIGGYLLVPDRPRRPRRAGRQAAAAVSDLIGALACGIGTPRPRGDGRPPARRSYSFTENPTAIGAPLSEVRVPRHIARHRGVHPIMGDCCHHEIDRLSAVSPSRRFPAPRGAQAPPAREAVASKQPAPAACGDNAEPGGEVKAVTQAILEEIDKRSELMANIEYLCDMIGPRLTGSPGLTKANHWTRDKFQQYGLANAHLESWTIERAWTRGEAKGRVVVPVEQRILLESAGWSPSTKGPVRGPVVHVKAQSADELSPYKGKLKGAWVVLAEVSVQPSPKQPRRTSSARCGGGCATTCGCASSARSSRSSWSPKGPPACFATPTRSTA